MNTNIINKHLNHIKTDPAKLNNSLGNRSRVNLLKLGIDKQNFNAIRSKIKKNKIDSFAGEVLEYK